MGVSLNLNNSKYTYNTSSKKTSSSSENASDIFYSTTVGSSSTMQAVYDRVLSIAFNGANMSVCLRPRANMLLTCEHIQCYEFTTCPWQIKSQIIINNNKETKA